MIPMPERKGRLSINSDGGMWSADDWLVFLANSAGKPASTWATWQSARSVNITVTIDDLAPLARHPALLFKLRGALGAQLMAGACETASGGFGTGMACSCRPVCPSWLMFATLPLARPNAPGETIAKPYVLAAYAKDRKLCVRLTLFGFASGHAEAARTAFVAACSRGLPWSLLAADVGVTLLPNQPVVVETGIRPVEVQNPSRHRGGAALRFVTGLEVNTRTQPLLPGDLFDWTASRVRGLAPWFGHASDEPQLTELRREWDACITDYALDEEAITAQRESSRSGQTWTSVQRRCSIELNGPLSQPLSELIVIGERIHVGRGAVHGLGRYTLAPI